MDLYQLNYKTKKDGLIQEDGPVYRIIVRADTLDSVEKTIAPWLRGIGVCLEDLFLVQAVKLGITSLPEVPGYKVVHSEDEVCFV